MKYFRLHGGFSIKVIVPSDEMRQFEDNIICGRCGNSDWTKFTYMLPMNGQVLVQCTLCYRMVFKPMDHPSHNDSIQK